MSDLGGPPSTHALAVDLLAALGARGLSVGVAESLTGGAVCAALVAVPGASQVVRGAVVSYATDVKHTVLGVDRDLLAASGAVDPQVAQQMAEGVRAVLGADVGLATTGVAGPAPADGQPVGTVYVAVAGPRHAEVRALTLGGSRETIRADSVTKVLGLALELVGSGQI